MRAEGVAQDTAQTPACGRHPPGRPGRGGAGRGQGAAGALQRGSAPAACSPRAPPAGGRAVQLQLGGVGPRRARSGVPPTEIAREVPTPGARAEQSVGRGLGLWKESPALWAVRTEARKPSPLPGRVTSVVSHQWVRPRLCVALRLPDRAGGWLRAGSGPGSGGRAAGSGGPRTAEPQPPPLPSASLPSQDAAQVRPSSAPRVGPGRSFPAHRRLSTGSRTPPWRAVPGATDPGGGQRSRRKARGRRGPGCARAPSPRSSGLGCA